MGGPGGPAPPQPGWPLSHACPRQKCGPGAAARLGQRGAANGAGSASVTGNAFPFSFSCFPFLSLLSSVVLLFLPCPSPLFSPLFSFLSFSFPFFLSLFFLHFFTTLFLSFPLSFPVPPFFFLHSFHFSLLSYFFFNFPPSPQLFPLSPLLPPLFPSPFFTLPPPALTSPRAGQGRDRAEQPGEAGNLQVAPGMGEGGGGTPAQLPLARAGNSERLPAFTRTGPALCKSGGKKTLDVRFTLRISAAGALLLPAICPHGQCKNSWGRTEFRQVLNSHRCTSNTEIEGLPCLAGKQKADSYSSAQQ